MNSPTSNRLVVLFYPWLIPFHLCKLWNPGRVVQTETGVGAPPRSGDICCRPCRAHTTEGPSTQSQCMLPDDAPGQGPLQRVGGKASIPRPVATPLITQPAGPSGRGQRKGHIGAKTSCLSLGLFPNIQRIVSHLGTLLFSYP